MNEFDMSGNFDFFDVLDRVESQLPVNENFGVTELETDE